MTKDDAPITSPSETRDVGLLFLANFVHQVVNPLNGVIGTLDNITDGIYKGPVVDQKINACRAQLEQCVSLLRNLAYLSDYFFETSGRESLKEARVGAISILPQVIIEAIQFFQSSADTKGIRIELDDPKTQYRIRTRPELLRQVFMNICDNWVKYGLRSQVIHIKPSVNSKGELIVEVFGESVGFANQDAVRLFELGFRARLAEERVAQGSGIGLYVCKQIMEKILGGTITAVHSMRTGVTSFRIVIPEAKWQR